MCYVYSGINSGESMTLRTNSMCVLQSVTHFTNIKIITLE